MNKIIQGVLLNVLMLSAAQAQLNSNRTYLRSRDTLSHNSTMMNMGKCYRGHHCKHDNKKANGSHYGCTVSVAGFYRASHNGDEMAQYFGGGQSVNNNVNGTIVIAGSATTAAADSETRANSIASKNMMHNNDTLAGTVTLAPSRTEAGAHINVSKNLSSVMDGLSMSLDVPLVQVETTMGGSFPTTNASSYFNGSLSVATAASAQAALTHARIDATKRSRTAVADIGAHLHYNILKGHGNRLSVSADFSIPTTSKNDGVNLFQPQIGNNHFGVGGSLAYGVKLWQHANEKHRLMMFGHAGYRYLFSANETRTLGLYNHWYDRLATAGQYRNLGKAAGAIATPAANVLTRSVAVTPGAEFDGSLGLKYAMKGFGLAIGYNLHAHQKETVTLNASNRWFDGEYGMLYPTFAMNTSGGVVVGKNAHTLDGAVQQEGNTATITKDSSGAATGSSNAAQYYISTKACTTPSAVTHKIFGSAELRINRFRLPFVVSAGGDYEFDNNTTNNSVLSWSAWGKVSFCF